MNVEIGTEAAQFQEKEHLNSIFIAVYLSYIFLAMLSFYSEGGRWAGVTCVSKYMDGCI